MRSTSTLLRNRADDVATDTGLGVRVNQVQEGRGQPLRYQVHMARPNEAYRTVGKGLTGKECLAYLDTFLYGWDEHRIREGS